MRKNRRRSTEYGDEDGVRFRLGGLYSAGSVKSFFVSTRRHCVVLKARKARAFDLAEEIGRGKLVRSLAKCINYRAKVRSTRICKIEGAGA